jgi:hypothetical protein
MDIKAGDTQLERNLGLILKRIKGLLLLTFLILYIRKSALELLLYGTK